ncbi:MAG: MFS family permease, partial [Candidatus Pseudothioglobus sp.]
MKSDEQLKQQELKQQELKQQHHLEGNLRRFVLFRLLYSARFYYPVFTILFLDYGLSLEQFGILNLVWALTIVVAEVPSGALADIVGRKRLLVFAVILMVIEMTLLVLVPIGASSVLFAVFLINRVFSGLSEAAASGADEALAYDSLKALGREDEWAHLLEKSTRVVSAGFFVAMISGAFAYDANLVNGLLAWFSPNASLAPEMVIRLPIVLTLCTSIILLFITLGLHDIDRVEIAQRRAAALASGLGVSAIAESFLQ